MTDPQLTRFFLVANQIAAAICPAANYQQKRRTRDMVRTGLVRAFDKGALRCTKRGDSRYCIKDEVFAWAVRQWPECQGKLSFKVQPTTGAAAILLDDLTMQSTGVTIPNDPSVLRERFIDVSTQLQNITAELERYKAMLANVTAERDKLQETLDDQRETRSENARRRSRTDW